MPHTRIPTFLFAAGLFLSAAWPAVRLRAAGEPAAPPISPAPPTLSAPPDEAARANATKVVHDLFGPQIDAAKSPLAKDELAKKLLQQGIDSKADPAGQFVLFKMARDLAEAVGDSAVALQSIDETARVFRLDLLALRQETLAALAKTATNPQQNRVLADAAWSALDDAIAADKFDVAEPLAAQGLSAAKRAKDADMLRQWMARGKDVDDLQLAYIQVRSAMTKLQQKPLDPAANLAVGRYLMLVKGDWDAGLPMVALGNQSAMQALAVVEMSPSDDAEAQFKLAEGWWGLADAATDASEKQRLQSRALYWYGRSLPNLSGLPKTKAEKRLQEATGRVFARVQAAMRGKKVLLSPPIPAMPPRGSNRARNFIDVPEEAGLLVGFELGMSNISDGRQYITAIRPLFLTTRGETQGDVHGSSAGSMITVRARAGFAVGGVTVKGPNRFIEGLSLTFMQIQGAGLDPRDAYTSDWYGDRASAINTRLCGSGSPVIGIAGKADNNALLEMALMQARGRE